MRLNATGALLLSAVCVRLLSSRSERQQDQFTERSAVYNANFGPLVARPSLLVSPAAVSLCPGQSMYQPLEL